MTKARNTKPDSIGVHHLKRHVLRCLESLQKGQFSASYGLKDSVELLNPEKDLNSLPERMDKDHPFNRFLVAVATEISKELGVAKKKKTQFVRVMEDKLFSTRKDWASLLIHKKSLPDSNHAVGSGNDEDEEVNEGGDLKSKKKESFSPKGKGKFLSEEDKQVNKTSPKTGKTGEDSNLKSDFDHSDQHTKKGTRTTAKRKVEAPTGSVKISEKNETGETEDLKNVNGDMNASSKRRKMKVSSVGNKDDGEAQSGNPKGEDRKGTISENDPKYQKAKAEFEAEKDRTLELLSDSIKAKFGLICLAKWGKEKLPALVLSPYSVAPGRVRREWFDNFNKKGRNMKNLVYWYGSYANPKEAFSFLPTTHITTLLEESSPHAMTNKIMDGSTLGDDEELELRVRDEILDDLKKLPEERRGQMGSFEEKFGKESDDEDEDMDLGDENGEEDFDYEDQSDGDSGNDSDYM